MDIIAHVRIQAQRKVRDRKVTALIRAEKEMHQELRERVRVAGKAAQLEVERAREDELGVMSSFNLLLQLGSSH